MGFAQTDGTLDMAFGTAGKVFTDPTTSNDFANHGIQLPDGSILAGGYSSANVLDYMMIKYTPTGQLDSTFGTNGVVLKEFGQGTSSIKKLGLQSDGKIIAAGRGTPSSGPAYAHIARFNPDGSLDTTFGTNGKVNYISGTESDVYAMHILPDNSIITVGYMLNNNSDILVIKLTPDGAYDTTFGTNGVSLINFGSLPQRAFCSVMNGDKILIGGVVSIPRENMLLMQLNANGSMDTSFGTNGGYTATSFWDTATFYDYDRGFNLVLNNGKIYQCGYRFVSSDDYRINLAKYNIDGTPDTTFSDDGKILIDGPGQRDFINDMHILNDQSILMGGHSIINNTQLRFILMKLNPDGSFASNFGTNGSVITTMNASSTISSLIVNETSIIGIGGANTGTNSSFALAKYHYANPLAAETISRTETPATIYPNPVGNAATLAFNSTGGQAVVHLYNNQGRLLKTIENKVFDAGLQRVALDARSLASGMYFVSITQNGKQQNLKFIK